MQVPSRCEAVCMSLGRMYPEGKVPDGWRSLRGRACWPTHPGDLQVRLVGCRLPEGADGGGRKIRRA